MIGANHPGTLAVQREVLESFRRWHFRVLFILDKVGEDRTYE
jgi:hypothetical protein